MPVPTIDDIKEIAKKRDIEKERKRICLENDICPKCGAKIISELYEKYDIPKKILFGLFSIKGKRWDRRKVCSKDKNHYESKKMYYPESHTG